MHSFHYSEKVAKKLVGQKVIERKFLPTVPTFLAAFI
jgi:hypothetical protein